MSKKIVYSGQSFLDKVLECTGDVTNAVEMAVENGINITDDLVVGNEVKSSSITKKNVVNFFTEDNRPATRYVQLANNVSDNYGFPEGEFPIGF
ncbi:hypothetical protein [Flavobacterium sp. N1994]|uniref:hypothetical protein n=1 Tax=Flavobacterium sp. N1994 TaxID=2986827 RepID=UPI002221C192|nr:hypothetical protein [Flavobacterium sp. N1994]